jgi:alanine dehydrogenase
MRIGVPKEIKDGENRVAITPAGVRTLVERGHAVMVQRSAGAASYITDSDFRQAGAQIVGTAPRLYAQADLILKVKEPLTAEFPLLRPGQILFTYLHLASSRELTEALLKRDIIAIGYETVQTADGSLPLLIPMSEVAGKMAVQVGARYLEAGRGGRGALLGGVPGVPPAEVVIAGCGIVGVNAAKVAIGMGAQVTILDINHDRLKYLDDVMHDSVITVYSNPYNMERAARYADLLIGAVLVAGGPAPKVISRDMVRKMKAGSVIVDVAIDQGGCVATSRPTSHSSPVFVQYGVVHYCVPNIPAAVPRTSTHALTNATLPYLMKLADLGFAAAVKADASLASGVNLVRGKVVHPRVAAAFRWAPTPLAEALA